MPTDAEKPDKIREPNDDNDRVYTCRVRGCAVLRSKREGGTIFTVCEKHWEETSGN